MKLRDAIEELQYFDNEPCVQAILNFFYELEDFGPAAYNYYDCENECYIITPAEDPAELLEPLDLFYEIDFDRDY
jgi:hypothetical protein